MVRHMFLLKYTSRDEVDVLAKGSGGTVDMRNNIAQYEETSPLFGLLRYRRRNVIIKYLPEGCSRLIQARLAVHFNAVCERFAPYDTTFDIAEAKELKDTKLSAACSLHTASESTSSSTSSLRRRRLMEIAEEEEGEQRTAKRQSTVEEEEDHQSDIDPTESRPRSPITGPPVTLDPQLASSPEASQFAGSTEPPSFIGAPRPASPAKSFETDTGRRLSSQSSRQDYYSSSSYYNKPRVKLGPRPSIEPAGKQGSSGSVRPVASMPSSLKLSFKGAKRTKTQDDSSSVISEETGDNAFLTPSIPLPGDSSLLQALRPRTSGGRPSTSSGVSVKSLPSISAPTKNTMTPEKLRLMKAMQLRERKKMASAQPPPVPSVQVTADPEEAKTAVEKPETRDETQTSAENDQAADHLSLTKIESEGDNTSTIPTDHASVRTQTDSRPPSPICASSEVGDSTKASSVSDSTEETIQGQGDKNEQDCGHNTGSTQEADTPNQDDARLGEAPAAGPDDAGIESGPGVEGQEVSQAPLTQTEQQPDTEDVQREVEEKATLVQKDQPAEHSFIPTSKFAKAMNGQAVVEPMGPDPHEVTSVPERIDEVGPAPVDPAAERTQDGSAASPPKWNLPISKYSTHDSSKTLAPSPIPAIVTSSTDTPDGDHEDLANAADTMEAESASSEKRSKRPEPINTDLDLPDKQPVQEDGQPAGEPQSATIQEGKPLIIASPVASPVTATSQGQPSEPPTPRIMRTVSSPIQSPQKPTPGAGPPSARSVSQGAAFHSRMNQQSASHLGPRPPGKLSGGLASRIKAFEQLATKPPSPGLPVVTAKDRPSSAFFSVRKNSIRDGAQSPAALERANSVRGRSPGNSLETSPEAIIKPSRERSGSVASRLSVFEGGNAPRGRPESISVTARIVRDPGPTLPRQETPHDHESSPLELRQSPLIIDHRKGAETPELEHIPDAAPPVPTPLVHAGEPQPRKSLQERRLSKAGSQAAGDEPRDGHRPGQRTSLTMARDFLRDSMVGKDAASTPRPLSMHQHHTSLMGRLSISSKRTSFGPDAATSPVNPLSPTWTGELSESGDDKKSKEGNRASRFMRRLSSSLSPRKQSTPTISPTLAEESVADVEKATPPRAMTAPSLPTAAPLAASLGDVNVQFPDNLLWKRRTVSLDTIGYLLLNAVQGVTSIREKQLKRYHLSEFKTPYAPEIEFQELPNSVCLDFIDGSSLQIAFQDRAGQLHGLHTLQENHKKHISSAS
ncbi:hypothetical protein SLS63_002823 [Diaporthe eres]|uniref:GPI-anchored cell surface glycoprotein n=1 Tax=Diaporthe eres TaxID=83184 RepID=A0ABR1PIR1_DIAER